MKSIRTSLNHIRTFQTHLLGFMLLDCLVLFVPLFYDAFNLPKLAVLTAGSAILLLSEIFLLVTSKAYKVDRLDRYLLLFLCINIFAYMFSGIRSVAFWGLYPFEGLNLFYIPSFLVLAWIFKRLSANQRNTVILYFFCGTVLSALYVLYRYVYDIAQYNAFLSRPGGTEGHPVAQAGIIATGLLLVPAVNIPFPAKPFRRVAKLLIALLLLTVLYILYSSTAWISLAAAAVAGLLLKATRFFTKPDKRYVLFTGLALIACVIGLLYVIRIKQFSIFRRSVEIKGIINLIGKEYMHSPDSALNFLFGHGQNTSGFYYTKYKLPPQTGDKEWQILLTNFHNHLFEMFFTTGIFSVIVWILLWYGAFRTAWHKKNIYYLTILVYLAVWQQFYLLLPSLNAFTWIIVFYLYAPPKKTVQIRNRYLRYTIALFILAYCIFSLSNQITIVRAEDAFSRNDSVTATTLAP